MKDSLKRAGMVRLWTTIAGVKIAPSSLLPMLVAIATCWPVQAAGPEYTLPVEIFKGFNLRVPVRVGSGDTLWCTLDSGAGGDGFVLDSTIGKKLGLHPGARGWSTGAGPGVVAEERVFDKTLEIGNLRIPHRTLGMRPLGESCLVGTVVLDRFVVELDYSTPAVRLYSSARYVPSKGAASVPLALDASRRPMIVAKLLLQSADAVDARLLLDSAVADYALSLSKAFIDKNQILTRVRKVIDPGFRAESVGKIDLLATRIERLSVGPVGMDKPIVMLFRSPSGAPRSDQTDGLIGSGFLHRFIVTIDVPKRRLYLKPNTMYRGAEPQRTWAGEL